MPAQCYTCNRALEGDWALRASTSKDPKVGRYLGIKNGFFLYGGRPDWVYVYCEGCWRKEVMKLDFVAKGDTVVREFNRLKEILLATRGENNTLKKENADVKAKLATFEDMVKQLAEIKTRNELLEKKNGGLEKLNLSTENVERIVKIFKEIEPKKELALNEEQKQPAVLHKLKGIVEKDFDEFMNKVTVDVLNALTTKKSQEEKELEELAKVEKSISELITNCPVSYASQETEKTLEQTKNKIKMKEKSIQDWERLIEKVREISGKV